jgi:hypothetical protein
MIGIPIEALADISDRKAIYQYVHYIIDNDNEPAANIRTRAHCLAMADFSAMQHDAPGASDQ